jgi:inhibitor of KinA
MIGFTPGFSYLGELPEKLFMPRLAVPKLHLLPGSIGISGYRTGIYPLGGPGGWQIIGCTPMKLFDPELNNPFKLSTGMTIKFSAISIEQFQDYQNKVCV